MEVKKRRKSRKKVMGECSHCHRGPIRLVKLGLPGPQCAACYYYKQRTGNPRPVTTDGFITEASLPEVKPKKLRRDQPYEVKKRLKAKIKNLEYALDEAYSRLEVKPTFILIIT